MEVALVPTQCAICGERAGSTELYPANLSPADFNPDVFSQRRQPDRVHYRIVRCSECGLVRSDPVADASTLESLYKESHSFEGEETNLRRTYGRYLRRLRRYGRSGGELLEIGSGTGFFLVQAQQEGYDVTGVEPSRAAAARAQETVAARIVNDVMRPGLFDPETFDVICLFQVFDHVPDPNLLLAECRRAMRPGGLILALNHEVDAITNRLLRDRSPIVDIEHTYLYSHETMRAIFERNGFDVVETGRVWNDYSLDYLARLAPLPRALKKPLLSILAATVGRLRLWLPLGNQYLIGRKPSVADRETLGGSDNETIRAFNSDVATHEGYVYTISERLSSRLARARWAATITEMTTMKGRTLLDLGCGDGYFTRFFYDTEGPVSIVGVDPSENAIEAATAKRGDRRIEFTVGHGHSLPFESKSFDIVLLQGVLHHDDDAADVVREACRLGREVIILEPNGYNPALKLIEKVSPYHRQHNEKSYAPAAIDGWLAKAGGRVVSRKYSNLVPVFAPDALARVCKALEPMVEASPGARRLLCGNYTVKALVD